MFFQNTYRAAGLRLQFPGKEFTFKLAKPIPIELCLRNADPVSPGEVQGVDSVCRVEAETEPAAAVRSTFETLARDELPDGYAPTHSLRMVDAQGNQVRMMPMVVYMPEPFRGFVIELYRGMDQTTRRVLDLVRWIFKRDGLVVGYVPDQFRFSFDRGE
jgi:hypothetical protein